MERNQKLIFMLIALSRTCQTLRYVRITSVKDISSSVLVQKPRIPKKLSFETYADSDNSLVIGPEGFERLCNDGNLPLEGAMPMILAWQLNSKEMAKISHDEWQIGMANLQCVLSSSVSFHSTLPLMLICIARVPESHPFLPLRLL